MKKTILIIGLLLAIVFIAGCGENFLLLDLKPVTKEDMINCRQGRYQVDADTQQKIDLKGIKTTGMIIINDTNTCNSFINLEKPVNVLGMELKALPQTTCSKSCIEDYQEDSVRKLVKEWADLSYNWVMYDLKQGTDHYEQIDIARTNKKKWKAVLTLIETNQTEYINVMYEDCC